MSEGGPHNYNSNLSFVFNVYEKEHLRPEHLMIALKMPI